MIDVSHATPVTVEGRPPRAKGAAWASSAPAAGEAPPVAPPATARITRARRGDDTADSATASGRGRVGA